MAFDEQGQAVTTDDKVHIPTCAISYCMINFDAHTHLPSILQNFDREGWLPPSGHHFWRQHLDYRHWYGGAQQLRSIVHWGNSQNQRDNAPRQGKTICGGGVNWTYNAHRSAVECLTWAFPSAVTSLCVRPCTLLSSTTLSKLEWVSGVTVVPPISFSLFYYYW